MPACNTIKISAMSSFTCTLFISSTCPPCSLQCITVDSFLSLLSVITPPPSSQHVRLETLQASQDFLEPEKWKILENCAFLANFYFIWKL